MEKDGVGVRWPVFWSVMICLHSLSLANGQSVCPSRCLCYIDANPRSITCAKQGLEEFPHNMSDLVEHLDLSQNRLEEIPDDINRLSNLKYLNLAGNRLTSLPKNLQNLQKLRKLDLSDNLILKVEDIASISQLPSIAVLHLSGNDLKDLQGLTSRVLQAVDASNCEIQEFNNNTLEGLPALMTLSLAHNPLRTIDMPSSSKLRWLDMSNCLLNYLKPDTFMNLPELEELRLADNSKLVYSTRQSTLTHKNLKKLDVSRCNLDRPGLHGLPLLSHARLSHNVIRLLPNRIFAKNRHLTHLYLDANALDVLHAYTFEGLVKLQVLDLSANAFEGTVYWSTFQENLDLRLLNLSYNALYQLPNFTSAAISIDVSANLIENIQEDCLSNTPRIRTLNLADNRVQALPPGLKSPTLRTLDLKRNRLMQLTTNDFANLPSLQRLDLSGNRLTEAMSPAIFESNPNLQTVLLSDNPWRCDCAQLYVTFEFLTQYSSRTASSTLLCHSPANVSGFTWEMACYDHWNQVDEFKNNRTWGFVLISFLTVIVFFGSVVSLRHTLIMKRRAAREREQLQRAEARERLRLLQRRNQRLEEELYQHPSEPRIHPMELVGPPSYEEAVQMPRLARSLDALDEISVGNGSTRELGSVDNLRAKKRRSRRPRKRAHSEDDLLKRRERREERIRRVGRERDDSVGNVAESSARRNGSVATNPRTVANRRSRRHSVAEMDSGGSSSRDRPRPQTPSAARKKRRRPVDDGHATDDEDSDLQNVRLRGTVPIRELRREPRSGHRESVAGRSSDS